MQEVRRPNANSLVARVSSVPLGAPLVVEAEDVAVLDRSGTAIETFGPGTHALTAEATPSIADVAFGDVLDAEIWFVRTAPLFGVKVGGPAGQVLDRVTNLYVRPRFAAEVAVRAADPSRLVAALVSGALPDEGGALLAWIRTQVLEAATRTLTAVCGGGTASFADLEGLVGALADQLPMNLADLDEYGLSVGAFKGVAILLTPEDAAALTAAKLAGADSRVRAIHCPRCGAAARGVFCTQCGGPIDRAG